MPAYLSLSIAIPTALSAGDTYDPVGHNSWDMAVQQSTRLPGVPPTVYPGEQHNPRLTTQRKHIRPGLQLIQEHHDQS